MDAGDYTINMWTREADVPGSTNVLASLPTAAALGLGTYYGNIDTSGDNDYFAVNVTAGQVYTFTFAGGAASNPEFSTPGTTAATLTLYNAAGQSFGSNLNFESSVSYFATQNTTIYLRAAGLAGTTGGYTLDVNAVDPSTRDPLESLNWDSADDIDTVLVNGVPTAYVYFGAPGENFGEAVVNQGWQPHQVAAVMNALAEYTPITGIQYVQTTDVNQAEFRMITVSTATYGARFYPQDPIYTTQQGIGTFNLASGGFGQYPQSLERGGYSYAVILHEFGHAHGVAHPHDTGGGSEIMLGVNGATGSLGVYNLNQGVYTVMSYNDAWQLHPDGASAFTVAGIDNGWSATLGAFDIAVLQARYGVHAHNTGDNVYNLTDITDDAFYQTIWDTGGTDTIAYGGTFNAQIDLTAATLDYTPTGGGVLSFLYNPQPLGPNSTLVRGGYTIANGVVIENASGGSGNDVLIGNASNNVLTGNAGNDTLMGRGGNDRLIAGAGDDRVSGGDGLDVISLGAGNDVFVAEIGSTTVPPQDGHDAGRHHHRLRRTRGRSDRSSRSRIVHIRRHQCEQGCWRSDVQDLRERYRRRERARLRHRRSAGSERGQRSGHGGLWQHQRGRTRLRDRPPQHEGCGCERLPLCQRSDDAERPGGRSEPLPLRLLLRMIERAPRLRLGRLPS